MMTPDLIYQQTNALVEDAFKTMEGLEIRGEVILTSPAFEVYGIIITIGQAQLRLFAHPADMMEVICLLEKINEQLK